MGWVMIGLLACAVLLLAGAEWPRLEKLVGADARHTRERAKRKSSLKLLRNETEEFAASVERDLSQLPTIEEHDRS